MSRQPVPTSPFVPAAHAEALIDDARARIAALEHHLAGLEAELARVEAGGRPHAGELADTPGPDGELLRLLEQLIDVGLERARQAELEARATAARRRDGAETRGRAIVGSALAELEAVRLRRGGVAAELVAFPVAAASPVSSPSPATIPETRDAQSEGSGAPGARNARSVLGRAPVELALTVVVALFLMVSLVRVG